MSRYEIRHGEKTIAYGFDRPLQTFFVQIFEGQRLILDSHSRADVMEILDRYKAPSNHRAAVACDLPF